MKFFFKFLIIFYTIFTSNLYSNTSKIPNEKVFNNPKKEVTTVEAKKNKEHAEMNIKVNKLSIQEIKGYNIGEGKTQYFIPKEEKENKLLKNLTNNTENQYLIFETKEQLSDYLNKNKKAKKKRDDANSIQYEVMQDEEQTMLTVNSSAELYILENDNKIYKGSVSTYHTLTSSSQRMCIAGYKDVLEYQDHEFYKICSTGMKIKWLDYVYGTFTKNLQYGINLYHSFNLTMYNNDYIVGPRADIVKGPEYKADGPFTTWYDVQLLKDAWTVGYRSWPWETLIESRFKVRIPRRNYSYGYYGVIDNFDIRTIDGNDVYNTHSVSLHFYVVRSSKKITIDINSSDLNSDGRLSLFHPKIDKFLEYTKLRNIPNTEIVWAGSGTSLRIINNEILIPQKSGRYHVLPRLIASQMNFGEYLIGDDVIYINFDMTITKSLDLTKAIPNLEYTINLRDGIGRTQYSNLDPNIHQIRLDGNLDLSNVSRAELWVNGSNYSNNSSYNGNSYNARLEGIDTLKITKKNYSETSPLPIILKLYNSSGNIEREYQINLTNIRATKPNINYTAEIDPRFFKVMEQKQENKLRYDGYINNKDYSALFNKTGGTSFSNIQSIASINNNYNLQNNSLVTYNGYGFTKGQSPLYGYKDLNSLSLKSSKTPDTVNLLYLGTDNYYQSLDLSLTNNSRDMNKVYNGEGSINLKKATINTSYTFTKDNLNNNGLTLSNRGEFITTGTSFNPNSDIVNKIIVNDNSTSHISGKRYNDNDIEITLGSNQISIKKLQDFTGLKSLKIDYYYNELKLGTYTLRITNTEQTSDVIIEGIDKINFGTLIPEKTSSLQSNFIVKSLTSANITLKVPTDSQMTQKGATSKTNNTIPLKIESTHQKNGNDINGWLRVSATPPKGTTPGEYEGTIDLTVTIE